MLIFTVKIADIPEIFIKIGVFWATIAKERRRKKKETISDILKIVLQRSEHV